MLSLHSENKSLVENSAKVNVLVRLSTHEDMPEIIAMGRQFHVLSGMKDVSEFDPASLEKTVSAMLNGQVNGFVLVAELGDELVGMTAGIIYPLYFNLSLTGCQELFWYCKPNGRNGVGRLLLDELESEASRRGAEVFMTAALAGLRDAAIAKVYERRGYRPMENTFVRKLS